MNRCYIGILFVICVFMWVRLMMFGNCRFSSRKDMLLKMNFSMVMMLWFCSCVVVDLLLVVFR